MHEPFRDLLESDRIHVFDGAMGTMLYAKGVYINRCYDELNLQQSDLVREVHAEYCAPAPTSSRPTPSARPSHKLQPYGLEGKPARDQHRGRAAGARSRRRSSVTSPARSDRWACASSRTARLRSTKRKTCSRNRSRRCSKAASICFVLETFSDISEMQQAIRAVRELCDLPIVAQMTILTRRQHDLRHHAGSVHRATR